MVRRKEISSDKNLEKLGEIGLKNFKFKLNPFTPKKRKTPLISVINFLISVINFKTKCTTVGGGDNQTTRTW